MCIRDRYSDGREGVPEQAGAKQHNIAEAAPNKLELGEGGKGMRAGHRQGVASGGVRQASFAKSTSYVWSFLSAGERTHIFQIFAGQAFRSYVGKLLPGKGIRASSARGQEGGACCIGRKQRHSVHQGRSTW